MPTVGFDVRDYSTGRPLEGVQVLVPRRSSALPPIEPSGESSFRARERRNYHQAASGRPGLFVVAADVALPCDVELSAAGFYTQREAVVAAMSEPRIVRLHRKPSYPFAAGDTVVRGQILVPNPAAAPGPIEVQVMDPSATVPNHRVPTDERGEFVVFIPEKSVASSVGIDVYYAPATPPKSVVSFVVPNRTTTVPAITVP